MKEYLKKISLVLATCTFLFSCDKFLEENGYAKKIRSGKYKIPKNAKYDEIAKIITQQN